jgi:hypothetical protein
VSKKTDKPVLEVRENADGTFVYVTLSQDPEAPAEVVTTSKAYGTRKEAEAAMAEAEDAA